MATSDAAKFLSQADFARHRGVSRKAVTGWKQKGLLSLTSDGMVNVEATEWALDQRPASYRGGVTHRPVRAAPGNSRAEPEPEGNSAPKGNTRPAKARPAPPSPIIVDLPQPDPDPDGEQQPQDGNSTKLTIAEAVQRKENYLGLKHKQAYEREDRQLVDRAMAEKLFFETARDLRDAWEAWPARVAIEMAAELGVDARALSQVLTNYVKAHLAELGEPVADGIA